MQQSQRLALHDSCLSILGSLECTVKIRCTDGIDCRVDALNPFNEGLHHFNRRDLLAANFFSERDGTERGEV